MKPVVGPRIPKRGKCRFCGKEVAPPRRTFCNEDCVDRFVVRKTRSGSTLRTILVRRAGASRCELCGFDAIAFADEIGAFLRAAEHLRSAANFLRDLSPWATIRFREDALELRRAAEAKLSERGFPPATFFPDRAEAIVRSFLEADHAIPLVEGGTFDLENLRLLCYPCHLEQTRLLAGRRAALRRIAREPTLNLFPDLEAGPENTTGGADSPRPPG